MQLILHYYHKIFLWVCLWGGKVRTTQSMKGFLSSYHFDGSTAAVIEVRGQRSGWPSPLGIISPVLIWLSETSASLANLIPEPGGRLGQITFLLRTDWTYGEINAPSRHSEHGDCLRQLCPYCVTQWGTQLVYEDIIVLKVVQILIMYRNVFLLAVEWKQYCRKDVLQIPQPLLASEGCC